MSAVIGNPLLLGPEGYQISRSVRLRSSASAYLNRTNATPTSTTTWTMSYWVKRGTLSVQNNIIGAGQSSGTNYAAMVFVSDNTFQFNETGASTNLLLQTTQVFRDPSAWYHFVIAVDTTQATASNRVKIYVNGSQITAFGTATYPTQNYATYFNTSAYIKAIGNIWYNGAPGGFYTDGYLTEINFIDGQALTPSSFGETDSITGVWKPKKYAGTYGTNGFYLNFSDNSNNTAATIGKDYSGNGNNWTPNNISVTSGTTYDSMLDVPTNYADGGNGRGNYCTLNPVFKNANSTYGVMATPISGNLESSMGAGTNLYGTQGLFGSKGKWYAECRPSSIVSQVSIGYLSDDGNLNRGAWINSSSGVLVDNVSKGTAGFAAGNIIGIAYDSVNNTVQFYVNGSAVGSAYSTSTTSFNEYLFWSYTNSGVYVEWNFGQRPFAYTPPSGFKALNTQNLTDSTIPNGQKYFDATTYTGNGTNTTVTNSGGFTPDLVWHKGRSVAYSHSLVDSVRGNSNILFSNTTDAESNPGAQLDITTNGFISTYRAANLANNQNGATYVGWQWKAGGAGSSNTSGSITSTVSVNATAGFSVVTYTGNGSTNQTVGHGLGVAPSMIIIKNRAVSIDWIVYHTSLGATQFLYLNLSTAVTTSSNPFNNTAPTSSVFTIAGNASNNYVNGSGNGMVAYCFSAVRGYSAFGSYTGNGNSSDGPFVYLGFRPRWIMVKRTDASEGWEILDTLRNTFNAVNSLLEANQSSAEITNTSRDTDYTANGFKVRNASNAMNASGGTYIYAAFAENPFKLSLAR